MTTTSPDQQRMRPAKTGQAAKPALVWTPHPMIDTVQMGRYRALSREHMAGLLANGVSAAQVEEYWRQREQRILLAEADPLRHGFEPAFWRDIRDYLKRVQELYVLGGNGPGKTEIGGKLANEYLCAEPARKVLCVTLNDDYSKLQQAGVYKYLPPSARTINERTGTRRLKFQNINYSQKGGFTEATFVLPNRSQCWFKTVEQYLRSATSFEGPEYDFIWLDEPVPVALVETLRYRAGKRSGKILHTFTAVNGYDAVCGQVLAGARVTKSLPMNWQWTSDRQGVGYQDQGIQPPELKMGEVQVRNLPPGHMPYMMQPLEPERGVLFAWTQWNAFLPRSEHNPRVPSLFEKAKGKSKSTVRMRLYGWVEKLSGCQFPAFNPNVHVLPHEKIEAMLKAGALTGRKACDPATARSYFLLWAGTDKLGRTFIFDESPRAEEGEWVSDDGNKGDGQLIYAGKGVNWYKGYLRLREREHGLTPNRNFGDPRAFATQAAAADGGRSLLELFAEPPDERFLKSLNAEEGLLYAPMLFEPARVMRSLAAEAASGSLDKINDALSYDADRPITVENEPHLYISERCTNLIRCLLNWDPAQGEKSPYKDPVDVLRYLFGEPFYFLDPELPEICGGRGW